MRRGQAMVEYVLVIGALALVCSALLWFADCARLHAARTESLVTMDCP